MNAIQGFGLFFLFGGAVGVCGGIERVFRKRALVRRAVSVNARIVDVESEGGTEPGDVTWYYPVVNYPVEGKSMRVKLPRGTVRQGEHRVGATVRVHYDPCDPTRAAAKLGDISGGWVVTILATVFVVAGAGCFWAGWNGGR